MQHAWTYEECVQYCCWKTWREEPLGRPRRKVKGKVPVLN